jgi:phospholipid/cholesterol/gamma-HCH transport system permease protein
VRPVAPDAVIALDLSRLGGLDTVDAAFLAQALGPERLRSLLHDAAGLDRDPLALLDAVALAVRESPAAAHRTAAQRRARTARTYAQLEQITLDALPKVALLTFIVGAVIASLGATMLGNFGACIYTIDLVGFSFLREFGILLESILLGGHTAACTAQNGSMKAIEEIDPMRALASIRSNCL